MGYEPIDLPKTPEGRSKSETIGPQSRRMLGLASAIIALALTAIGQTIALVKGCRAEDVAQSSQQETKKVGEKVKRLTNSSNEAAEEIVSRDDPQVRLLNALVHRMTLLERLVLSEASNKGAQSYRAKKKTELKPIPLPEKAPSIESEIPADAGPATEETTEEVPR